MGPPVIAPARDVRTGGRWSPAQRVKNDALWAAATVAIAALRSLPVAALRRLGRALGLAVHALAWGPRRVARDNVGRALPHLGPTENRALVRRCFATVGEHLGETVALLGAGALPPLPLAPGAIDVLHEARREGRGVVFISAHLGPWERVAASLVAAGLPLVTVARESYDPRFTRLYERLRSSRGVRVVWRSHPAVALRMVRVLRAGGVLGIPMDLRSRVASADVPFLGHAAPTPIGPARIALRTRAAVVVGTLAPTGAVDGGADRYAVTVTRIQTGDLTDAYTLTARLNDELSRRILGWPEGWVWMHERWTERKKASKRL
jgi:Kdo2-lipid IVA lauroyltransferase/acyltransferase